MYTPVPIAVVAALRERIRCLEGGARHRRAVLPFGIKAIDGRLPGGGLALGALHEGTGGGNGAIDGAAAALFAAGIAARTRGRVLWCVTRQDLFAPALAAAGLAPDQVIYVEAGDEKSVLACFEEGLRHPKLGTVVGEIAHLSMTASRRLQLAAEGSGVIGLALRRWRRRAEAAEFRQPTAATTRWRVSALPSTSAGTGSRSRPMAARTGPVSSRGLRDFRVGGVRRSGSTRCASGAVPSTDTSGTDTHVERVIVVRSAQERQQIASPSPRESLGFSLEFEFGAHGSSLSTRSTGRPAHLHGLLPPILSAHGYDLAHLLWYVYRDLFLSGCLLSGCTHRRYDHNDPDRG